MSSHKPQKSRDPAAQDPADQDRVPTVGVIYNPRSHHNKGQDLDSDPAPHVFVSQPGDQSQLPAALRRFVDRGIDLLVINGGDGTVRDVLTAGYDIFGDDWPAIAVLPKGKTNALTVDLEAPGDWSLQGAIDAYRAGGRIKREPLVVEPVDDADAPRQLGFILGAGVFTLSIKAGQNAHRFGAFNALAVGVTTAWTVLQTLLGSRKNRWRRGSKMAIGTCRDGTPLAHSGHGDADWRLFLFASTLHRFPAGLLPFGKLREGLKLVVLDQIGRLDLLRLPPLMLGREAASTHEHGIHQLAVDCITLSLEDDFILDGEAYPGGDFCVRSGPMLEFVRPL